MIRQLMRNINLKGIFNKQSKSFLTAFGFVLVVLIWVVDYLTGPEFSSLTFYLIPIIFVTWFVGRLAGILISVTSAIAWVFADMIAKPPYSHIIIPFWNLAEKLAVFLIVVYILLKLTKQYEVLKFERKQFLSILDSTDDLIYISDPESYEILYANNTLRNLFGLDIISKKCYETLRGMEKPCDFCTNKYIFGENIGKPYVWEYHDKVNQRWYRCIDRAIKWPGGKWARYATAVDISAFKELEKERKNILSMFAHDMKNPIIIAAGFLSRVLSGKAGPLTEKQINYMELMCEELNKLERFITNFLEFSRLEAKEYKPVPLPFNIEIAIKKHIEGAKIQADKKNIKIMFEIPEDIPVVVNADAVQIDRVIANLLDNAIKYSDSPGTIIAKLLNRDEDILVQVIDTGIGIPEDHLPYIFDAFFRASRNSMGAGLGLSIAKTIVEAHGGKIWVESTPQKGSTFIFTIPKR